jgi:hypothetical protein
MVSSPIAATVSVSSTIRRQSRAAIVPMLTLSWLWHSVLRLKTLAGIVSFKASAASADAEICIALKPWCAARSGPERATRLAGRPALVSGLQTSAIWRSTRSARLATAVFRASSAKQACPP